MDRESIKSIKYTVENTINKGIATDLQSDFRVEKSGAEVKDRLKTNLVQSILRKNEKFRKLESLVEQIGEVPEGKLEQWELRGLREKLPTIPYKYSYTQMYDSAMVNEPKQRYNSELGEYIDLSIDCLLFKTILDSIDDNKVYQLNIQNATNLGF